MSTTITSLLNSLHTHLQSQTQLLPTLHHQLGLSATALADDLSTLQKELTECMERQIDTRRREVDQWMTKCEEVEKQCISYANALGGNGKASGSSVGEIRKEQVLPKRFERITEHQERLRQVRSVACSLLSPLMPTSCYPAVSFQARTIDDPYESCRRVISHSGTRLLSSRYT